MPDRSAGLAPPQNNEYDGRPLTNNQDNNRMFFVASQFVLEDGGQIIETNGQTCPGESPIHIPVVFRLLYSYPDEDEYNEDNQDTEQDDCDTGGDDCEGGTRVCNWVLESSYMLKAVTQAPGPFWYYDGPDNNAFGSTWSGHPYAQESTYLYTYVTVRHWVDGVVFSGPLTGEPPSEYFKTSYDMVYNWGRYCNGVRNGGMTARRKATGISDTAPKCPGDYPSYGSGCVPSGDDPCGRGTGTPDGTTPGPGC